MKNLDHIKLEMEHNHPTPPSASNGTDVILNRQDDQTSGGVNELNCQALNDEIVIEPYESLTKKDLIACCYAHDAHHIEHHENDALKNEAIRDLAWATKSLLKELYYSEDEFKEEYAEELEILTRHAETIKQAEEQK